MDASCDLFGPLRVSLSARLYEDESDLSHPAEASLSVLKVISSDHLSGWSTKHKDEQ